MSEMVQGCSVRQGTRLWCQTGYKAVVSDRVQDCGVRNGASVAARMEVAVVCQKWCKAGNRDLHLLKHTHTHRGREWVLSGKILQAKLI